MKNKIKYKLLCVCLSSILLIGCGTETLQSTTTQSEAVLDEFPFGVLPDLSYEIPVVAPNVLVNRIGYGTQSNKIVIFKGGKSEDFEVVEKESGNVVFTGKIYANEDDQGNQGMRYGNFTGLEQNGEYYIQTKGIGRSYTFAIGNNLYEEVVTGVLSSYQNANYMLEDGYAYLIEIAAALLAYELYPHLFVDARGPQGSSNYVPDILDDTRQRVDLLLEEETISLIPQKEKILLAGVLAKFSTLYKGFDNGYSTILGTKAEELYQGSVTEGEESVVYFAAAELYKSTAKEVYHTKVRQFDRERGERDLDILRLFADISYMTTRNKVDVILCGRLMESLVEEVEKIGENYKVLPYLTLGDNREHMLENTVEVVLVDHIMASREYATMIESQIHYFLGRNESGESLVTQEETGREENGMLLLFMCQWADLVAKENVQG